MDTSGIRADSLWLQAGGGTLVGRGRYRTDPASLAAQVELREIDLARLPLEGYAGTVDGRMTVDGPLSALRASLALELRRTGKGSPPHRSTWTSTDRCRGKGCG